MLGTFQITSLYSNYIENTYICNLSNVRLPVKNSEYDQKIPQSQTADKPMAPRGRATQPSRDTRKTN